MRKIKNNVFMLFAVLPIAVFFTILGREMYYGNVVTFLEAVQPVLGDFGAFFEPIIRPLFMDFVALSDEIGVANFAWVLGYYVTLLFINVLWSLFTFLITIFMDKVDRIKGVRR